MQKAVAGVAILLVAGCGASHHGALDVRVGMTHSEVRHLAGDPEREGPKCWFYRASKKGTSIDGVRVCFAGDQVSLVQRAVHG